MLHLSTPPHIVAARARLAYGELGGAAVHLSKYAGDAVKVHALSGELQFSQSGWGLLKVPNALVRGAFDALDEHGIELPIKKSTGQLNAHISVFRPEDIEQIGGADKIHEWGHHFSYTLGPVKEVAPAGWKEVSKVWFIEVHSPDLEKLRKSYGLSATPKNGEHEFHITLAIRKKHVLTANEVSKAAADEELDPEIEAEIDKEIEAHRKEKRYLGRYKCPHCGGTNMYNGIPGTGTTFRGSGHCQDCDKGCSIVGLKLERIGDGPEIVSTPEQEADYRKTQRWMKREKREREKDAEKRGPEGEYCPHCDARLERDPSSGTCNACGKAWAQKAAGLEKLARLITLGDGTQRDHDELAQELADKLMKAADDPESRLLHNTMLAKLKPIPEPEDAAVTKDEAIDKLANLLTRPNQAPNEAVTQSTKKPAKKPSVMGFNGMPKCAEERLLELLKAAAEPLPGSRTSLMQSAMKQWSAQSRTEKMLPKVPPVDAKLPPGTKAPPLPRPVDARLPPGTKASPLPAPKVPPVDARLPPGTKTPVAVRPADARLPSGPMVSKPGVVPRPTPPPLPASRPLPGIAPSRPPAPRALPPKPTTPPPAQPRPVPAAVRTPVRVPARTPAPAPALPLFERMMAGLIARPLPTRLAASAAGGAAIGGTGTGLGLLGDRRRVKNLQQYGNRREAEFGLPITPPPDPATQKWWRR